MLVKYSKLSFYLFLFCIICSCSPGGSPKSPEARDSTQTKSSNLQATMAPIPDPHSFAQADQALMNHLALDLHVDFSQKILKGVATIHFEQKDEAEFIYLDTQGLRIDKVTEEDTSKQLTYELSKPFKHLGSALKVEIGPETQKIKVFYETSPGAEALQWLDSSQTADKKHPFLFTQSQAILARSWIPCQDSPGIRFTYEARVQVPAELLALMSAENPQEKNDRGVYSFSMKQPIPAYLMALAVGDLAFASFSENTGVYAEPSMLDSARYEFASLPTMLSSAEKLYGDYAWERYDILVLPPSFPFGGMENPRLTFATPTILAGDRSLVSLVAHELAHSWSGNLVTNATWNDFWLNEGFTVFFERRIMEALEGKDYAEMLAYLGYQDLVSTIASFGEDHPMTQLHLNLEGKNPDDGVTDIAYEKGYFFLRLLEETLGREKMDTFLINYFEKYAFKGMDTEQFVEHLRHEIPLIDSLGLKQWIYEPGLPGNCPVVVSRRFERVDAALKNWNKNADPNLLYTAPWSSHEWLYFLRALPDSMDTEQLADLDEKFKLTQSGNAEILTEWLQKAVLNRYEPAQAALESFLIKVGRRKFLMPLYQALLQNPGGKEKALLIYEKARPNYHYVATNSLDALLGYTVN